MPEESDAQKRLKEKAIAAAKKRYEADALAETLAAFELEFTKMLRTDGITITTVYSRRKAHEAAVKACREANGGAAAAGERVEEPAYVPLDPQQWWREQGHAFKYCTPLARILLNIQISAAEVERLFSRGGLMITPRRNCLGADKEERLMVTAYNTISTFKAELTGGKVRAAADGAAQAAIMRCLYPFAEGDCDRDGEDGEYEVVSEEANNE